MDAVLRHSERGQSAPIGVALLLGITLLGVVSVVTFGAVALNDTQQQSQLQQAEHVMTQFDSQASQVALGSSETQSLKVGRTGGDYRVDPDAGTLQVIHVNFDGGADDDGNIFYDGGTGNDDDQLIYETTLGAVIYENGDETVAYQGGGVWRGTGNESRMVSPPEFHYRGSTLTFPVIRVNQISGEVDGASGTPRLTITQEGGSTDMYPNASRGYYDTDGDGDGFANESHPFGDNGMTDDGDSDGGSYLNPATDGTAIVVVQSEYYVAWGQYFSTRTEGNITYDHPNETVVVELISTGFTGQFQMPGDGGSIEVRGVTNHSISEFGIVLADPPADNADLDNMQWSMWAEDDDRQFEIHLRASGTADDGSTDCTERDISLTVYYSPADGDADQKDPYQGWYDDDAYQTECVDRDGDGSDDEERLVVDFIDPDGDDPVLTYQSITSSQLQHFGNPDTLDSSVTFDQHPEVDGEPVDYDEATPSTETSDFVLNHYFSLLGDGIDLTVDDKDGNQGSIYEQDSTGVIQYTGGDRFITYIHLTQNDISVRVD